MQTPDNSTDASLLEKGPYKVNRVFIQVELQHFNPTTGEATDATMTAPVPVYEAHFPPGLKEFLINKGLSPENFKVGKE